MKFEPLDPTKDPVKFRFRTEFWKARKFVSGDVVFDATIPK